MRGSRTEVKINLPAINRYHIAAIAFMLVSSAAGIALSGSRSPALTASGWRLIHAYVAFMGFGTLMILGNQVTLIPFVRRVDSPYMRTHTAGTGLLVVLLPALALIWLAFLGFGLTESKTFLYPVIPLGAVVLICLISFSRQVYPNVKQSELRRNLPLRFFATSLFMCFLAYGQLTHITINMIQPILPFAKSLSLRHSYLAFSIPISLTVMGVIYTPFNIALKNGLIKDKKLWEIQYAILVFGVFALFFALLFDNMSRHAVFATLQLVFSMILTFSIVVFAIVMFSAGGKGGGIPSEVKKHYFTAIFWLAAAGVAGLLLGMGWKPDSRVFYFLVQAHIHLALIGWVGLALSGALYYLLYLSGPYPFRASNIQYAACNAGIVVMCAGIFIGSAVVRGVGGALVFASFAVLLRSALDGYRGTVR